MDTMYWVEAKLWGQEVFGYHLVTIALHVASALLLVKILGKLQIRGAWLAAAIFALHPVLVESVAWMVELKNTLSGLFFFAAILAYLNFDQTRRLRTYLLVGLLFTLGILAKAIVATVPAVVLILIWWKRGRVDWQRDVKPLLPFVVLAIAAGLLTAWMERAFSGAEGEEFQLSVLDRFLIAGRAFWFYIGKLLFPNDLSLIYPRWKIDSNIWWQYLFPVAALGLFWLAWNQRKRWRWFFAASLFFAATVVPLLGFFNVSFFRLSFVADHFAYVPSLAVIVPTAAGATWLADRGGRWRLLLHGLLAVLLSTLAILSWMQSHMYRDAETCYRMVVAHNPNSWTAHQNIGAEVFARGQLDDAAAEFHKVLELEPNYAQASKRAYFGLGGVSVRKGKQDEAIKLFETALKLDPTYGPAHNGIASALHRQGRLAEAIAEYERAIYLRPESAGILSNLAWMLATCSDPSLRDGHRALALAQRADRLSGGANPRILRSLAAAYAEVNQFGQAAKTARHALDLWLQDGESSFTGALRREISLFDAGRPYHESGRSAPPEPTENP
ncbi:MAG TPA: tetratricopeptide repeat protein [Chthoniobacterales bacterium]|nr:tetratricopeptide repeat protein [Chthoniobacterales bacterium]